MALGSMTDEDRLSGGARRRLPHPLALAWFLTFAGLLFAILFTAFFGKASDGSPVVRLDLAAPPARHAAAAKPVKRAQAAMPATTGTDLIGAGAKPGEAPAGEPAPPQGNAAPGAPAGAAANGPEPKLPPNPVPDRILKPVYAGRALVADPALIEVTPQGPLPRIADDGRTPMAAYAPKIDTRGRPRIALVVSGLGISARATQAALDGLPAGVTLAFAPYAADVQRWVAEARGLGHEVLLEVPMEPYDFPDSDPGPHTLRPMLNEDGNIQRLSWSLSRFTGYAGVTNLLGGRFLANSDALAPVMTFLARRGLLFYDSGSTSRSAAEAIASQIGAPYAQSSVTIDTIQSGMEIDQRLSELEARARTTGAASGTGFLYPVTIGRIAAWARGLEGRGFVLVPASAIVAKEK